MPTFETIMKPLLKNLEDGKTHKMLYLEKKLANDLNLTEREKKQQKPSGGETLFKNRLHWSRIYLRKAGLVTNPKRAHVRITTEGKKVLRRDPPKIDTKYLMKYTDFKKFYLKKSSTQYKTLFESVNNDTTSELMNVERENIREIQKEIDEHMYMIKNTAKKSLEKLEKQIQKQEKKVAEIQIREMESKIDKLKNQVVEHKKIIEKLKQQNNLSQVNQLRNYYVHSMLDSDDLKNWLVNVSSESLKNILSKNLNQDWKQIDKKTMSDIIRLSTSSLGKDLVFLLTNLAATSAMMSTLDKNKKHALKTLESDYHR